MHSDVDATLDDQAERRQMRQRVEAALDDLRRVEAELEEIAIELAAGEDLPGLDA